MKTNAQKIGDLADQDGSEVPKKFDEALGFAPLYWRFSDDSDSPIRYEFADGSAIVVAGASWDYGVHAHKLERARDRYKPEGDVPVEFAWVGAGYGLTEDDALPRERGKKVMPFVKIMSDADAQAFIAANPGALWFLSKALTVEDVKYRLQEISACDAWNEASAEQINEIADQIMNNDSLCEQRNDSIAYVAAEVIGEETDENELDLGGCE